MSDTTIFFVQEFCNMDLSKYLQCFKENELLINAATVKSFMYQLLEGIRVCHESRIVHRDLKPANILLAGVNNDELKIADFGLARAFSIPIKPYTKDVVTLWYRSPELLLRFNEYATPVDIWSAGCTFFELATRHVLFKGENENSQLLEIFRIMGTPTEETWEGIS